MDALEARMQFIHVLKSLPKTLDVTRRGPGTGRTPENGNDSSSTGTNPVQFYLAQYPEHHEDLQQCMLDIMGKMDTLDRLYIAIYYHRLVEQLSAENDSEVATKVLGQFLLPGLPRVYELACPLDQPRALTNLPELVQLFQELKEGLGGAVVNGESALTQVQTYLDQTQEKKQQLMDDFSRTGTINYIATNTAVPSHLPPLEQTVLNRMEMDRDRHKKQKEQSWHVHRNVDPSRAPPGINGMLLPHEFDTLWDNTPALTPSDIRNTAELHEIAASSYRTD